MTLIILIVIIGIPLSKTLIHILTEAWWFDAVGFSQVFWTRLTWQILLWVVTFVVYAVFLWANYQIARRLPRADAERLVVRNGSLRLFEDSDLVAYAKIFSNYLALVLIVLIALGAASASDSAWEILLKYLHPSDFGSRDPIFGQDISFYVFRLPLYEGIRNWLLVLFSWGLILSALVYALKGRITRERGWQNVLSGKAKSHLSLLVAAIACLIAIGFWLERYHLLYSPYGVAFGAGYTDVHARLFAYSVMSILTLVVAVLFVLSAWQRGLALPICGIGLYFVALVLFFDVVLTRRKISF